MYTQDCRSLYGDSTGLQCLVGLESVTLLVYTHDASQVERIAIEADILQVATLEKMDIQNKGTEKDHYQLAY